METLSGCYRLQVQLLCAVIPEKARKNGNATQMEEKYGQFI